MSKIVKSSLVLKIKIGILYAGNEEEVVVQRISEKSHPPQIEELQNHLALTGCDILKLQ